MITRIRRWINRKDIAELRSLIDDLDEVTRYVPDKWRADLDSIRVKLIQMHARKKGMVR